MAWSYLKHFVAPIPGTEIREVELTVVLMNGAIVRLYGADNYDRMRGVYFDGVVIDEPADMDPRAWPEVVRPALADYAGWAVFIGTPRGRNHFHKIVTAGESDPEWTVLRLPVSKTKLLSDAELTDARRTMSEEQYEQEFECSFDAAVAGCYYAKLLIEAERGGRIAGVPHDPAALVWTAWDLGIRDATAIWFAQIVGREIRVVDYYEASGVDLGHYVREIKARPYVYGGHIVPHDAKAKELGTGKSRLEVLESLGLKHLVLAPLHRLEDGINGVRVFLPRCWFERQCARGIEALKLYRSDYDEKLQALRPGPVHDWTSHAADAFRYLAMTLDRNATLTGFSRKIEYPKSGIV